MFIVQFTAPSIEKLTLQLPLIPW